MLRNNLKYAWRSIRRNKLISLINVSGLALGLMLGVFILLFLKHELSYDRWIPQSENIYRVVKLFGKDDNRGSIIMPGPLAASMRESIPGVSQTTRRLPWEDMLLEYNGIQFSLPHVSSVDSLFFQTLPIPLLHGNAKEMFSEPSTAVLSFACAKRIFGDQNPIGESVLLENSHQLKIVGVLDEPEGPSYFQDELYINEPLGGSYWTGGSGEAYVRLDHAANIGAVEEQLYEIAKVNITREYEEDGDEVTESDIPHWKLQALEDMHLQSEGFGSAGAASGSLWQLKAMGALGLIVLLLAAINFINLTTAQTSQRAAEVGTRKANGATRQQLVSQFLMEAVLVSLLAMVLALLLTQPLLSVFNDVVSRPLLFSDLIDVRILLGVVGMSVLLGLLAGALPSFYLSGLNIVQSLKGKINSIGKTKNYRRGLVAFQFTLSISLILAVTLIWQQLNFMMQKDLGFNDEQIMTIRINQEKTEESFQTSKTRLLNIPGVEGATQISRPPGGFIPTYSVYIDGDEERKNVSTMFGDIGWNETFEIPMVAGRFFSNAYSSDTVSSYVVNEAFVNTYRLENPVGHQVRLASNESDGKIIGVVKDFHYQGLQKSINPLILSAQPDQTWMGRVAVRINTKDINTTISNLEDFWQVMEPSFPMTYEFVNDRFAAQYAQYRKTGKVLLYTAIFCILVALLGLFGLSVFVAQQRTKEIGVRKVLGASVAGIVSLVSKDFLKPVAIAFVIACPIAIYFISEWLNNFAYRIEIQWWVFLLVGLVALGLAFIAVSGQTLKAALVNPVESLRNE